MIHDPMDMMAEMDELFDRIISRVDREFPVIPSFSRGHGFFFDDCDETGNSEKTPAPGLPEVRKPVTEVHTIGDEVKVVAELPGASGDEIRLCVRGNSLIIDAGDGDNHLCTTAELPPVDAASLQRTLKNGILEVTFRNVQLPAGRN